MSKGFKLFLRILIYCFSIIPIYFIIFEFVQSYDTNLAIPISLMLLVIEIIIVEITLYIKNRKQKNNNAELTTNKIKVCKYCRSEINSNATVCPICKRGLSFNTNIGVLAVLLIIVGFLVWGIFSNNAPLFMRKTVCGLGIRSDFPYCYYIDVD